MKNTSKQDSLQRDYFHRLLSDRSVDDKMPLFTRAIQIFEHLKKKARKRKKR